MISRDDVLRAWWMWFLGAGLIVWLGWLYWSPTTFQPSNPSEKIIPQECSSLAVSANGDGAFLGYFDYEDEFAYDYAEATGAVTPSWELREKETLKRILEGVQNACQNARQERQTVFTLVLAGSVVLFVILSRLGPFGVRRPRVSGGKDDLPAPEDQVS